jgi:hypothetical protein
MNAAATGFDWFLTANFGWFVLATLGIAVGGLVAAGIIGARAEEARRTDPTIPAVMAAHGLVDARTVAPYDDVCQRVFGDDPTPTVLAGGAPASAAGDTPVDGARPHVDAHAASPPPG